MTDAVLAKGDDDRNRCAWSLSAPEYIAYHDDEWGRPVVDDVRVYEKLCLEGFQAGLSWITILRKRDAFRKAFRGFDPAKVARFDDGDVARLLDDAGIVRHRGKIEAAIANARATLAVQDECGSLAGFVWQFAPTGRRTAPAVSGDVPARSAESTALSKALVKRGFRFVGPTTAYAAMQALGLVDDHFRGCHVRTDCERQRRALVVPLTTCAG